MSKLSKNGATVSDDDGLLTCLECGRRFRGLGPHLWRSHGLRAAEYRERHGLPATAALMSDDLRIEASERRRQMLADDPSSLDHLKRWHDSDHLAAMNRAGVEAHRDSGRGGARSAENRLPGQQRAVQAMRDARLAKLTAAVHERGYSTVDAAIEATLGLSAKAAARATGLSAQTVTRRREARARPT